MESCVRSSLLKYQDTHDFFLLFAFQEAAQGLKQNNKDPQIAAPKGMRAGGIYIKDEFWKEDIQTR